MKRLLLSVIILLSFGLQANASYTPSQHKQIDPQRFLQSHKVYSQAERLYHKATALRDQGELLQAFNLYHLSAMHNYAPAQYQLGMMFRHGSGIAKNRDYAKFWIKKAAHNRYAMAIDIYNTFYAKKPQQPLKRYARY